MASGWILRWLQSIAGMYVIQAIWAPAYPVQDPMHQLMCLAKDLCNKLSLLASNLKALIGWLYRSLLRGVKRVGMSSAYFHPTPNPALILMRPRFYISSVGLTQKLL